MESTKVKEDKNPISKRLLALLLVYAIASVVVAKLIAELAFSGNPL
jgi:hypothetical protein